MIFGQKRKNQRFVKNENDYFLVKCQYVGRLECSWCWLPRAEEDPHFYSSLFLMDVPLNQIT